MSEEYDVIVIGGGPAGLTAALYLGRARKSVLVLDRGNPRHAVSAGVHNFLTREGMAPAALREEAWSQMGAYPSVQRRNTTVAKLDRLDDQWLCETDDGGRVASGAVLLATGVIDEHPNIAGFRERWGHSVHHCPFCHGWEARDTALAVLVHGKAAGQYARLIRNWTSDVVVLTNGEPIPAEARKQLADAEIAVHRSPVVALEGPGQNLHRIVLEDGTKLERDGLFWKPPQKQVGLVEAIGAPLDEHGYVETDAFGKTSLPMLWAAGDLTSGYQQVVEAAAQGARAAVSIIASSLG